MKFLFQHFSKNLSRNFDFRQNLTRIVDTLREDQYTFLITFFSELEMFRKKVVEKIETYFTFKFFFLKLPFYGTMWKNKFEPHRPQMTI